MHDADMREPLFLFLEAGCEKIRIFEEVNIRNSRCDVFTVTDCLTGYEIKSDADTYARLSSQTKDYDLFFNKNYLVIGKSHLKHAAEHVPKYWGIIAVGDDVEIIREAEANKKVRIARQMSLLWKRELRNILKRRALPRYPYKGGKFIGDRIIARLGEDEALKEICTELFERDYVKEGFV